MDYDILKPQLVWINGSCYRKNTLENVSSNSYTGGDTIDDYDDERLDNNCKEQEYGLNDISDLKNKYIIENVNGRYKCNLQVASAFFAIIIGKKAITKKRIENETNTSISIPKQGIENEDLGISGDSKSGVANACSRIMLIVESARAKLGPTHFISMPLNSKEMQNALIEFKCDVLESYGDDGNISNHDNVSASIRRIDETIFQFPNLLHLTIGTLALMDGRERQEACELLEDCKESIILPLIGASAIKVEVSGLEIMNDDPAEVDVIYAKVQPITRHEIEENVLQKIADRVVDKFVAAGLMRRQYDRVKLHLTVMNSLFRRKETSSNNDEITFQDPSIDNTGKSQGETTRETIDARGVLKTFGTRKFALTELNEMHLSQLKSGRRTEEKYYYPSVVVRFSSCG